jgi:hypothetical protein
VIYGNKTRKQNGCVLVSRFCIAASGEEQDHGTGRQLLIEPAAGTSERDLYLAVAAGTPRHAGRPGRSRRAERLGHCVASEDLIGAASEDLVGAARAVKLCVLPFARNLRWSVTSAL